MKEYIKNFKPRVTLVLILVLFVSNILVLFLPKLSTFVMLYPSNITEPLNWYRFFSYPLMVGGLITWIINSLVMLLTGFIIENRIKKSEIIGLILLSSFIGGLVFILFNQNDINNVPIASPTMISWGYWAAAIIIGLKFWKTLNLFEKIIMILCFLSIFSIQNANLGFLLGQISVIVIIMLISLIKIKKK